MGLNITNKKAAWVSIELDEESNCLINQAAQQSNKQKKQEFFLRLKDHLIKFKTIAQVGDAQAC